MTYDYIPEQTVTKERPYSELQAWLMWSLAGLFYCYQFVLRVSPGVMTEELMRDYSVESYALGILSAFYYYSYSVLQIPIGLGMDKFGPSFLLRWSVILTTLGTLCFAVADSFTIACFGRLITGAGSACAFLGALKLATLWFKPERLALVVGFTLLAGKIGAALGQGPLATLVDMIGWRQAMYIVIIVGILLSIGIWNFVSDRPLETTLKVKEPGTTSFKTLLFHLKSICIDYRIWALGLYGAFMYVPMSAFADLWGVPYLMKVYDIDKTAASSACTMLFIGAGVGSPVVAMMSDYIKNRKYPMIIGAILAIIVNSAIVFLPNLPFTMMCALLFISGFVFSSQPLIFAAVSQITPYESNGTAVSFTNMIVMLSGVILQPLIGWVLDWAWDGIMNNGLPLYTVENYQFALSSIPICLLFALFLMPLIPETFPKEKDA